MTGSTGVDGGCNSGAGSATAASAAAASAMAFSSAALPAVTGASTTGVSTTGAVAALALGFLGFETLGIKSKINWFCRDRLGFRLLRGVNGHKCRQALDDGRPEWFNGLLSTWHSRHPRLNTAKAISQSVPGHIGALWARCQIRFSKIPVSSAPLLWLNGRL
jgi:hypothetical protein